MTYHEGHATPEDAARDDIPEEYVTVLGVRIEGHEATVWMLTNDRPPFEAYTEQCHREHGRWFSAIGSNGLSGAPPDVLEQAAHLGW
jgi:hypothetical protein